MKMIDGLNRPNLEKLKKFLAFEVVPEVRFTMQRYSSAIDDDICTAAGCAVGFGTLAGIEKYTSENFIEYSERALVEDCNSPEWIWCFSADWAIYDNTQLGAAKRIQYLLDSGVPEDGLGRLDISHDLVELYADIEVRK
jgi:hypothetical protein